MSYTVDKYKWFVYEDRRTVEVETSDDRYDLTFMQGDKFGYFKRGKKHNIVHRSDLKFQVTISEKDAERLIKNSKGWKGKIRKVQVMPGTGGKDKTAVSDKDTYVLDINSSNLRSAVFHKKLKAIDIEFHSGVVWRYEEVTLRQAKALEAAESQGRYFHYKIKLVKPQYKLRG